MNILNRIRYRFKSFPKVIAYGDKYDPAMKITDPDEAKAYFDLCVRHAMTFDKTREEAEEMERINIGYWAGYYGREVAERVYRLFGVEHPYFGAVENWPTQEEAFEMGKKIGVNARTSEEDMRDETVR